MKQLITALLLLCLGVSAQAREVVPLNEGWRFFFKSENSSDNARYITLPHTWNTDAQASGYFLETTANYQNDIFIPQECASKRIFIKFYGVQSVADLFVNGSHVGEHRGGATAFTFEITNKLRFGAENALLMVVSNNCRPDVLPSSTDMNLYGGIYRDVELIITDKTAISPLYFGSDGVLVRQTTVNKDTAEGEVQVHLTTAQRDANCMLTIEITAPNGHKVFSRRLKARIDGDKPVIVPFSVDKPALWSPSQPALYQVTASLGDDNITDQVTVRTGFRTLQVTPKTGLTINGERVTVRGVTLSHDNAISGGTLTEEDYDADLKQIRSMGANAIRSAVWPHAQYLYDRCDEQGMLVWVETPLSRAPFLGDMAYYSTPQFEQNGLIQLREIIIQHYNHPSVAMWGVFSLLLTRGDDVTPYIRTLNDAAHKLDPSRPTVACSDQNGGINFITDLIVWQQDVGWSKGILDDVKIWRDQMQKSWSHLRSGVSYGQCAFLGHKSLTPQSGSRANWYPEERQTRFHEEYARNLQGDSLFWGTWINNMYDYGSARRPYGINGTGLVTLNRRDCKDAFYLYKTLWNKQEPTLHITGKRMSLRDAEQMQTIKVYSSGGTPTLLVNADTVTMHEYAYCQYLSDTLTKMQGKVKLLAMVGTLRDSVTITVGNVLKQKQPTVLRRTTGPLPTN